MMVTLSVFERSQVNYLHKTYSKASLRLEEQNTNYFSKEHIRESANSKYRANILYQVTLLTTNKSYASMKNHNTPHFQDNIQSTHSD